MRGNEILIQNELGKKNGVIFTVGEQPEGFFLGEKNVSVSIWEV